MRFQRIFTAKYKVFALAIMKSFLLAALIACCFTRYAYCEVKTDSEIVNIDNFYTAARRQGVPVGWRLVKYKGTPVLMTMQDIRSSFLRMVSSGQTAFGIKKEISVDIRRYPYLHWSWKAVRLPAGGDIRRSSGDDQALQIYVIFPAAGFPELYKSPAIAYIWDNEAPKGLTVSSPQASMGYVRYMVLKNKTDTLDTWHQETRNILQDYKRLFPDVNHGQPPGPIRAMLLFINTHHTDGNAEGHFGDIYFSKTDKHRRQ